MARRITETTTVDQLDKPVFTVASINDRLHSMGADYSPALTMTLLSLSLPSPMF